MVAITPFPDEQLLVLSGAHMERPVRALQRGKAEAIMVSFEYIRGNIARFHERIAPLYDWPVRLYLDSGLFTVMRKAGVHRTTIARAKKGIDDPVTAVQWLADDYLRYLSSDAGKIWHHVVELDCHYIPGLGVEAAEEYRQQLFEIVGQRLIPVWHDIVGFGEWESMTSTYRYVAIGGGSASTKDLHGDGYLRMVRHLTSIAHANGSLVHGLGETKPEVFRKIRWDSADSTTWLNAEKYGQFNDAVGATRYSGKNAKSTTAKEHAKARAFEQFAGRYGITPDQLQNDRDAKLYLAVILMQQRQARIRLMLRAPDPSLALPSLV